jgi:hypothetical protein
MHEDSFYNVRHFRSAPHPAYSNSLSLSRKRVCPSDGVPLAQPGTSTTSSGRELSVNQCRVRQNTMRALQGISSGSSRSFSLSIVPPKLSSPALSGTQILLTVRPTPTVMARSDALQYVDRIGVTIRGFRKVIIPCPLSDSPIPRGRVLQNLAAC